MAQTSVAQLATDLKMPADALLEQLQKAGVAKNKTSDPLTERDKSRLLEYLRRSYGVAASRTKVRAQDSLGKQRTVQVVVLTKRVLVRRDSAEELIAAGLNISRQVRAKPKILRLGVRGGGTPPPLPREAVRIVSHGPTALGADMFKKTPQHAIEERQKRFNLPRFVLADNR
jgi:translation initiation factor IF-2